MVKWTGYKTPTWEPRNFVKDLVVLDTWEAKKRNGYKPLGGRTGIRRRKGRRGVI